MPPDFTDMAAYDLHCMRQRGQDSLQPYLDWRETSSTIRLRHKSSGKSVTDSTDLLTKRPVSTVTRSMRSPNVIRTVLIFSSPVGN